MLATNFGYTPHYSMYRLTLAQAIGLIETRNDRECKQNEESERRADPDYVDFGEYPIDDPDLLPTVDDVFAVFSGGR